MLRRSAPLLIGLALSLLLGACGGSSSRPSEDPQSTLTPAQWAAMSHGDAAPASGMPAFPSDASLGRSISAAGGNPVLGSQYLLMANSTVEGTALRINTGAGDPANGGGADGGFDSLGWAMYGIGGLSGQRALSLNVECLPGSLDQEYYVGVADFTHTCWDWSGPVNIPEYQFDLSGSNSQYISALGNLYFVIVCWGDSSALHSQSTVVTGEGGGSLPGAPRNLDASDGLFPDGVMLSWEPGAGAVAYEVQRSSSNGGQGDPNGGGGWESIGQTVDSNFFDTSMAPGVVFAYRVRGTNSAGFSGWSNEDTGFSGDQPPPYGDYPLQGTVYTGDPATNEIVPMPGVVITVQNADGTIAATAQTDATGYYYFPQLPFGGFVAVASLDGWNFDPQSAYFQLGPDCPAAWIDFYAFQGDGGGGGGGGTEMGVYGNVFASDSSDPNGQLIPIPGATLTVSNDGGVAFTATTDEQGFYQFLGLEPGVYVISASKDGYAFDDSYTFQWGDNVPDMRFDFYGRSLQ